MQLIIMNKVIQIAGLSLTFLLLGACEQPASEVEAVAETPPLAETNSNQLASIDADGNIAPFGFASKQPVEVPAAVTQETVAAVASTSEVYSVHCAACHGADATGVEGLGLNLVESELVTTSSQAELTAFLKEGRLPDSPDSVTGVPMPSFVWMSDAQLAEVTGYLQGL
jgi:mono/diheme cytochrome c family protein